MENHDAQVRNGWDGFSKIYDEMVGDFSEDTPFYLSLAANPGRNRYLEVGCGSGRVLLPFLREGYTMTGVDIAEKMLNRCREKTSEFLGTGKLTLINHNFARGPLPVPEHFNGAFVTWHTLNYVKETDQLKFLGHISESLVSSSPLALDILIPVSIWGPDHEGEWETVKEIPVAGGKSTTIQMKHTMIDDKIEKRTTRCTYPDGRIEEFTMDRTYISPEELKSLLESIGFHSIKLHRGYSQTPSEDYTVSPDDYALTIVGYKQ